jgi:fatty acid desaturase
MSAALKHAEHACHDLNRKQIETEMLKLRSDAEFKMWLRQHSQVSVWRELIYLAFDWLIVGICLWSLVSFKLPILAQVLLLFVVGSRQHALMTFVHEAAHYRISENKLFNDFIGNFFAAYPVLFSTSFYRKHHLAHHQYLNSESDPDVVRRKGQTQWQFPQNQSLFFKTLVSKIFVGGYEWLYVTSKISGLRTWNGPSDYARRILQSKLALSFFALIVGAIFLSPGFAMTCGYWMVALLVVVPLISHVRSVSEHWGLPWQHDLNDSRNILASPLELFFFGPHGVNLHLAHHLFPSVPFYHLPKLHAYLNKFEVYKDHAHNNSSYFLSERSVLNDIRSDIRAKP